MQYVTIYLKTDPPYRFIVQMEKAELDRLRTDWVAQQGSITTAPDPRYGVYEAKGSQSPADSVALMLRFADIFAIA